MAVVATEVQEARRKFPAFNSIHEAEAVIREEMDELTVEVRRGYDRIHPRLLTAKGRQEAIQLAAMAIRLLIEESK